MKSAKHDINAKAFYAVNSAWKLTSFLLLCASFCFCMSAHQNDKSKHTKLSH